MKLDQLIVQHFYNSKKLTLQGIGTFLLNYNVDTGLAGEKDIEIPDGAIEFQCDPKAGEDGDLINFIVEKTRKIRPLAAADLDSFLTLGKQFLNIGKPFRLEGIGTLLKGQSGSYEFSPGVFVAPKLEASPTVLKEKHYDEVSFNNEGSKKGISKKSLLLGGLLLILLAAAGGTWWYFTKYNKGGSEDNTTSSANSKKDTLPGGTNITKKDTVNTFQQNTSQTTNQPSVDGYTFKAVIKEGPKTEVEGRLKQLTEWNYKNLIIAAKDSVTYRLLIPFTNPITDTARVQDSLRKHFGNPKVYVIQ